MIGFFSAGAMQDGGSPVEPAGETFAHKLISWWDFDGDYKDLYGPNHLSGTGTFSAGHIGDALTKSTRAENPTAIGLPNMGSSSTAPGLSFGGWFYLASTGAEDMVLLAGSTERFRIAFRSGNQVHFISGSSGSVTISSSVGAVAVGNWYFVVAQIERSTRAMSLWLNGTQIATGTASTTHMGASDRISFGRPSSGVVTALRNDSSFISGDILTSDEIAWLYSSGAGRSGADVLAAASRPRAKAVGEGLWTWFNDPRAIAAGSYDVVGCVTKNGTQRLYYSTDDWASSSSFDLGGTGAVDDHDNPAILRRSSDGRLVVAYVRHNAANYYLRVSTNADDPTAWGSAIDIASDLGVSQASYANLVELTDESKIFNYFRDWPSVYVADSSDGESYGARSSVLPFTQPYLKFGSNGVDRVDFLATNGHPDSTATSVYHFYYEGGTYHDSAGTTISLPLSTSTMTLLWDGSSSDGWIWDIVANVSGPVAVYSHAVVAGTDHRYRFARWNGLSWDQSEICQAGGSLYSGQPNYSGGVCIDPDDDDYVYACREVGGEWGLYRYRTTDSGATWDSGTLVFSRPGLKVFRPYIVPGSDRVLVCVGDYTSFSNYNTAIMSVEIER